MRVLVIESDPTLRDDAILAFSSRGHHVTPVDSVEEASRWIEAGVVDVVVSDIGSATARDARLLKSINTQRHPVPVVITTSGEDTASRARIHGLNADVLEYPFTEASLDNAINRAQSTHHLHTGCMKILPFLTERLEFTIPSRVEYLDAILNVLTERLVKMGIVEPDSIDVVVALDEAIVNAIKHGNDYDPTKQVEIVAELSRQEARFVISDQGNGFREQDVPDPCAPENLLRPSGRGLLLIKNIMDEVSYNDVGNSLTMIKRANTNGDGAMGKTGMRGAEPDAKESRPRG